MNRKKSQEKIVICPRCHSMVSDFWGSCPKCESKLDHPISLPINKIAVENNSNTNNTDTDNQPELPATSRRFQESCNALSDEYNADDFESDYYETDLDKFFED